MKLFLAIVLLVCSTHCANLGYYNYYDDPDCGGDPGMVFMMDFEPEDYDCDVDGNGEPGPGSGVCDTGVMCTYAVSPDDEWAGGPDFGEEIEDSYASVQYVYNYEIEECSADVTSLDWAWEAVPTIGIDWELLKFAQGSCQLNTGMWPTGVTQRVYCNQVNPFIPDDGPVWVMRDTYESDDCSEEVPYQRMFYRQGCGIMYGSGYWTQCDDCGLDRRELEEGESRELSHCELPERVYMPVYDPDVCFVQYWTHHDCDMTAGPDAEIVSQYYFYSALLEGTWDDCDIECDDEGFTYAYQGDAGLPTDIIISESTGYYIDEFLVFEILGGSCEDYPGYGSYPDDYDWAMEQENVDFYEQYYDVEEGVCTMWGEAGEGSFIVHEQMSPEGHGAVTQDFSSDDCDMATMLYISEYPETCKESEDGAYLALIVWCPDVDGVSAPCLPIHCDPEDEDPEEIEEETWACADGQEICASYYCDGHEDYGMDYGYDCEDESDEVIETCCAEEGNFYSDYENDCLCDPDQEVCQEVEEEEEEEEEDVADDDDEVVGTLTVTCGSWSSFASTVFTLAVLIFLLIK